MNKFELESHMVDSIEYMRNQDGLSFYGIISAIASGKSNSDLFNNHSDKILKYFNDFDNRIDDENFIKCFLGHYEIKESRFKIICPSCDMEGAKVYSASIECNNCSFVEQI